MDRNLSIAYGNNCFAKTWSNKTITFADLKTRLKTTTRTTETVEEYPKLPKAERDRIKDVGGFVGGHLKNNRRKLEMVESRSMLTLDADHCEQGYIEELVSKCSYEAVIYSTHRHKPEAPRIRVLVPFTRDVSPDEYTAIARYFADEHGIDHFDEVSYRPHQLMYWPTTSMNGEYVYKEIEGDWLDPDDFLSKHPNWRDCSLLPTSSKESTVKKTGAKQQDPLSKPGIVGAFCRAYSPQEAIAVFLSDVYEPSTVEGRYDYIPADSSAGVVIYDDKFSYSHHASDPAAGQLLNSFDLVRIHKFKEDDEKKSFKAMSDFAMKDEKVKKELMKERLDKAKGEFGEGKDWRTSLEFDRFGNLKDSLDNLLLIIRYDTNLAGIALNKQRDGIDVRGSLPWDQVKTGWSDTDLAALKAYISETYGIYSPTKTKDALTTVAAERAYHPIQEWFEELPDWDGIQRVDTLLIDYFGAEDSKYVREITRKTLVAAVARIYTPGIKFDSVLILNGPQGCGKSTFFAKLGGDWFSDSLSLTDMKDKAAAEKLQGYWILELGELNGMKKADVESVKSFITRTDDKYRAAYGVNVESHPRQCIVVGTTNAENGFLRDITGNRRFWPIRVDGDGPKKPWQLTDTDICQIWAEAMTLYKRGEKLYLEGEAAVMASSEQAEAMETDEREGLVRKYLDTLLPDDWDKMTLAERRNFLDGTEFGPAHRTGTKERTKVCNMEIWAECFGNNPSSIKTADSYAITAVMKKIVEWNRYDGNRNGTFIFPLYGKQRAYVKKNEKSFQND